LGMNLDMNRGAIIGRGVAMIGIAGGAAHRSV
jgi:hypothetical protein